MNERERIAELEGELAELRARVEASGAARTSSRRTLLRLAVVGTGAAVAGVVRAGPASAITGSPAVDGATNNNADQQTTFVHNGTANNGPAVSAYRTSGTTTGVTYSENAAIVAETAIAGQDAIVAFGPTDADASGVHGFAFAGRGVVGTSDIGTGVFGEIRDNSPGNDTIAMRAVNTAVGNNAIALKASATGGKAGLGGSFDGTLAPLRLVPAATAGAPKSGTHAAGELYVDSAGRLFYCRAGGTPGTWSELTAPPPPSLHPVVPARVYDSRVPQPSPGALAAGQNRTISVANGRDIASGAVTTPDLVPGGATAIAYNVTVTNTVNAGFLTLNPGGIVAVTSSTINWSASGQILTAGNTVAIPANRQVTFVAGGTGSTDFVLDVVGYYA
jgi:hypothetical protein